jgi:phosphocarrier protein HPr
MVSKEITITAPDGLHVRPLARFAEEAKKFESDITLEVGGKSANGKSIFKLQMLGLPNGAVVTLSASGSDEEKALADLAELMSTLT